MGQLFHSSQWEAKEFRLLQRQIPPDRPPIDDLISHLQEQLVMAVKIAAVGVPCVRTK
jgi:hypothetical protein